MSWLNLNQSLNSLKGQITNFASEVLSESIVEGSGEGSSSVDSSGKKLEEKCHEQELEIAALKKLNEELQASLQAERLTKKNGIKEDESSWYWDPPSQSSNQPKPIEQDIENIYMQQIRTLQAELSTLRERDGVDFKQDFDEELHRLREENKHLATNLEDLDNQHQLAMERLLALKKDLQANFELLKQEHGDLKSANDEYSIRIKTLAADVEDKQREIDLMLSSQSDYDTLHHKYQNLERIHSLLRENAEKFQEENQDLHEEIFKLQEQVTKLEHDQEILIKQNEMSNTIPKEKYEETLKELSELKDRRSSNDTHLDEINIDDNAKSVIENLKRELNELRHKLSQVQTENHESDAKLIKSEKIMQLYNKYISFELPVDYVGEIPSSDVNIVLHKLENVFKTLLSFKEDIDMLDNKLTERNINANHLQAQIDDLTTENDFLATDIQHYERQLGDMKSNNDFLLAEIAALKNTSKLQPIIETHEDNLVKLETELADCNRINKTFESEMSRIEKELDEVRTEKTVLQESLKDLKNKYSTLLSELEMFKTQAQAVEELENNASVTQAEQLRKTTDEIDDLRKRLNNAFAKNEQLSIDIHIVENDKVLLTNEVDELKRALEENSYACRELETVNISLQQRLEEFEQIIADFTQQRDELTEKVKNLHEGKGLKFGSLSHNAEAGDSFEVAQLHERIDEAVKEKMSLKETVDRLTKELLTLKVHERDLISENSSLKNCNATYMQNTSNLHQTVKYLKAKLITIDTLSNQVNDLEHENKSLVEMKVKLEAELSSCHTIVARLEGEHETVLTNFYEKCSSVDTLNSVVESLRKNIYQLENDVSAKNQEIETLKKSLEKASSKLNAIETSHSHEEFSKLLQNNEIITNEITKLKEEINSKDSIIATLKINLEQFQEERDKYKSLADEKEKEIKGLNKSVVGLTDKIETNARRADEYKNEIKLKENELSALKAKCAELENTCVNNETYLNKQATEHQDLVQLVNLKHDESVQYHNETNRLNCVLKEKTEEFEKREQELLSQIHSENEYKSIAENKEKELKDLNHTVVELTDKIKTLENCINENIRTAQENELANNLKEKELSDLKAKCDELENTCLNNKDLLKTQANEHNDLVQLVNLKHNESVQYHNEINRLNLVLIKKTEEFEKKEQMLLSQINSEKDLKCENLLTSLKEKDQIIIDLRDNVASYERIKSELTETIKNLTEKCDNLDKSLAIQLDTVKKVTAENIQLSEKIENLTRELERLREHLVETEENYTQELMTSEQKLSECQTRLHQVEERAKQNSTVYTSNSIRSNQEVETLRNQIKLLEKQREEGQTKLSDAEDAKSRSEAALVNLQIVLEQFQMDKERDIEDATEKLRNKLEDMKLQNTALQHEKSKITVKLNEALAGLQAAARLGDQVENKTAQINDLKEQVRLLQTSVAAAEERYYNAVSNQQDKVDKNLVKNLVINYVLTAANSAHNKTQVLRILSTVLDFNQQECEKLGLVRNTTAPDSLAAEFVKFLQNESRPRPALPNMMGLAQNTSRASTPPSRKSSTLGPHPNPYEVGHKRNPSTGSNNLLFQNIDSVETASTISLEPEETRPHLDTGVNQTRNTEGAILKHVLKDM